MNETNADVANLFTKFAHYKRLSIIFIVQNLFPKGKHSSHSSLNAYYIVVLKNPRDKLQIEYLSRQMMPRHRKADVEIFEKATMITHSFVLFDLTQQKYDALGIR